VPAGRPLTWLGRLFARLLAAASMKPFMASSVLEPAGRGNKPGARRHSKLFGLAWNSLGTIR
jgi:hypothetical protein